MVLLIYSCRENETCGVILKIDGFVVCKHVPDHSVWVSDSQQPFVEQEGMDTDVLYMKERQPLVFPCRVTHPNVTADLVKVSTGDTPHQTPPLGQFLCHSPPHRTKHIPCSSSLVPVPHHHHRALPSPDHSQHCSHLGSHYTVACVSICLRPSADMCESVCGCVCERRRLTAE